VKRPSKDSEKRLSECLQFAEICIRKERFDAANYFLTTFLEAKGPTSGAFYLRAVLFNAIGDFSEAIINARCAVEMDPTHYKGIFELAKAYDGVKDYDQAIWNYERMAQVAQECCTPTEAEPFFYQSWAGKTDCLRSYRTCANCDRIQSKETGISGWGTCGIDRERIEAEEIYKKTCDVFQPIRVCRYCGHIGLDGHITESLPWCTLYGEFISRVTYWRCTCDHYQSASNQN